MSDIDDARLVPRASQPDAAGNHDAKTEPGAPGAGRDSWRIARDLPYPLYYQLKQSLLHTIRSQQLRPGDRLPTESEIEAEFRVSRSTIRQALSQLVAEGVVERIQGKGTFVATPQIRHVPRLTSFAENMRAQGYAPTRRVLDSSERPAAAAVAELLEIREGDRCRYLKRLLLADARPVGIAQSWIPIAPLTGHEQVFDRLGEGSLYECLQGPPLSLVLHRGIENITAELLDESDAELLGSLPETPALMVSRISWIAGGRPIEWTKMTFAGSRYEYQVELGRPNNPS